ncbi:MAG: GNAT family N-acetyltransferase [Cyanobacteria bacterium P01_D01_bin.36]
MTARHLEDYDEIWADMLEAAEQPDKGWSWSYKLRQAKQEERFEAYAIEVEGLVHGLLYLETQWHRSELAQRYPLIYVQALVSAPWNRKALENPPYLRGVGKVLLLFARERSQQLGYQGRVGLHAIPEAEGFYHRMGMPSYGADAEKEGLIYFEYGAVRP